MSTLTLVPLRQHFEITAIWLLIYIQRHSQCIIKEVWAVSELLIFELWPEKHLCWQSRYSPGGDTGTKSIIHGARAWSQIISVQSRRSRLKPIHRLPKQHLPEENGSTFAVSQSFTEQRQQRRWEAETNVSGISQCFTFIYLCRKMISIGNTLVMTTKICQPTTFCMEHSEGNNVFHSCPAAPHLHLAFN